MVFKWNIQGSAGKWVMVNPFLLQASDQIFTEKTTWTVFLHLGYLLRGFCYLSSEERDWRKRPTVLQYFSGPYIQYKYRTVALSCRRKRRIGCEYRTWWVSWLHILYKITLILYEYQLHLHSEWLMIIYLDSDSVMILYPDSDWMIFFTRCLVGWWFCTSILIQ